MLYHVLGKDFDHKDFHSNPCYSENPTSDVENCNETVIRLGIPSRELRERLPRLSSTHLTSRKYGGAHSTVNICII